MSQNLAVLTHTEATALVSYGHPSKRGCPKCGGRHLAVAYGPYGLREKLGAWMLCFPVECERCGRRFSLSVLRGDLQLVLRPRHLLRLTSLILLFLGAAFLAGVRFGGA